MTPSHTPKINIVTPSFNQSQFIRETIESVVGQHDPNLFYTVYDGGSTDKTVSILKKYTDSLVWESKRDRGQSDALNKGWKHILSSPSQDDDIIAYINSDDYYLPESFSLVREAFAKHPEKEWLVGDAYIVDGSGHIIQEPVRWYKRLLRFFFFPSMLFVLNPLPQPAVFIRVSAARKAGLFNEELRYTMDYEYWLRLVSTVGSPLFVTKPLAAFRIHLTSKGSTQYTAQFQEQYEVAKRFTSNPLALGLHKLHTGCILFLYNRMK